MKIKTVKKLNLHELIQYVWENEVYPCRYVNNFNGEVIFNDNGKFMTDESFISPNSYFTVEVEEELTEDTEFEELWESYWDSEDLTMTSCSMSDRFRIGDDVVSINGIKSTNGDISKTVAIFYKDTLIWSAEHGIPESGVLEVVEF